MVSSRVVDFFPSERAQRGLQGGHQGKRLSAARRNSIRRKARKKQDRNVGTLVFCPTVGANVLVCSPERGPLQQQVLGKALKRADSGAQSLEPARGGPARPLRRSSQQNVLERVKYKMKKISYPDLRLNECIYRP
ncbi:hypothetical protein PIB30_034264 [Stylosanthes scabra]|uniref:Uncharacterized protein n=1 Tax=Stylosanthes scabra TaxID=79078 RepID=A0ABU6XCD9_9FABA|nr:hypothetical protein [Stylosanthes scabra]